MYIQQLPGGLCFAHGPYAERECPKWPSCATAPQQQRWIDLAEYERKKWALFNAAATLEDNGLLPEIVSKLRQEAAKGMETSEAGKAGDAQ
jgi:hypothetical protein